MGEKSSTTTQDLPFVDSVATSRSTGPRNRLRSQLRGLPLADQVQLLRPPEPQPMSMAEHTPAPGTVVQRHAFVNGKQVTKDEPGLTAPMLAMVKDGGVRNYESVAELEQHAGKSTDYLGNLDDGTWVRFSPSGINLLGENHTLVTLEQVAPAVGSANFIYEPFSMDVMPDGSKMKEAYEDENAERFKKMGIGDQLDKSKFGAESLFPKMGYAMTLALPYFNGSSDLDELKAASYVGKPIQRYLKIAWGHSQDDKALVTALVGIGVPPPDKMAKLAAVHDAVAGQLEPFITGLPVDGYLGDALDTPDNKKLLSPLATFALAFTDAMVELAAASSSSRLSPFVRALFTMPGSISEESKLKLFADWRNFKFEDSVAEATGRGVRYAGMGQEHLLYLMEKGLSSNQHPFLMADLHLAAFRAITTALASTAVPQ